MEVRTEVETVKKMVKQIKVGQRYSFRARPVIVTERVRQNLKPQSFSAYDRVFITFEDGARESDVIGADVFRKVAEKF